MFDYKLLDIMTRFDSPKSRIHYSDKYRDWDRDPVTKNDIFRIINGFKPLPNDNE